MHGFGLINSSSQRQYFSRFLYICNLMKTIIDSKSGNVLEFSEILKFRSLLWNLSMRDVLVRYKQTSIGVLWAIIRPAINIAIFVFFSQFIETGSNLSERVVNVGSGIIIWSLLSGSITEISNSLVANSNILTKVYFPKLIIPVSTLVVSLLDFFISFVILVVFKLVLTGLPGVEFFLFPVFILYGLVICFAIGLIFATLNVKYRDVKFTIPFILQIGFYVCPVFLSASFYTGKLPEFFQSLYLINPFVTVIEGFKYCLNGGTFPVSFNYVLSGIAITLVLFILSLKYFTKFEKSFADHI